MITKTVTLACDHLWPLRCDQFLEGARGESRSKPLIKKARGLGWVCSDGRQVCPAHQIEAR